VRAREGAAGDDGDGTTRHRHRDQKVREQDLGSLAPGDRRTKRPGTRTRDELERALDVLQLLHPERAIVDGRVLLPRHLGGVHDPVAGGAHLEGQGDVLDDPPRDAAHCPQRGDVDEGDPPQEPGRGTPPLADGEMDRGKHPEQRGQPGSRPRHGAPLDDRDPRLSPRVQAAHRIRGERLVRVDQHPEAVAVPQDAQRVVQVSRLVTTPVATSDHAGGMPLREEVDAAPSLLGARVVEDHELDGHILSGALPSTQRIEVVGRAHHDRRRGNGCGRRGNRVDPAPSRERHQHQLVDAGGPDRSRPQRERPAESRHEAGTAGGAGDDHGHRRGHREGDRPPDENPET